MAEIIMAGVIMGLLATGAMDLWALALNRFANQPLPNWAMPGRWVAHLPGGTVFHDAIAEAPPVSGELQIGWTFHYAVGILYGVALAAIMGTDWLAQPTFLPAWIFSILMVGFGWFLLQPGMGLGWAAAKTPNPWKVRIMNLVAHTVFALGLWVGAMV
ncbi:MAG: DUF2938 domain-containing protein [Boseongicola sp.]|nr:DUF2938 domain-containing protein [Boseongicola sp.]